jgi:3D (Asp-Asp-Asp) domain-containing protein
MKKIYISVCALAISISAIAQVSNQTHTVYKEKKAKHNLELNSNKFAASASAIPFWSEDFSGGIPATWTNSTAPWVYRGPNTTPNNSVGGIGAYSGINNSPATNKPIESPTRANGFIIFDSDYYDNNGSSSTMGLGMYPSPHNGELTTDMIDLSNYTDVSLKVNSYFRTFQGQAFVAFYVNGVYDSQIQVHSNLAVNASTDSNATSLIRLPFNVCGNANVQMQFLFDGTTQSNVNGSGYYFWMLDDLELMETPAYLIESIDQNHGGWDIGYASTVGSGMDFTFKPLLQSNANPYMFEMSFANIGANDVSNIQMNINVEDANGTSVFSSNSTPSTLAVLDTVSYLASQTFAPTVVGVYDMNFWGTGDSITATNMKSMSAIITDTVYGRDYNNPSGSWRVARDCGGMQLGNKFDVYAPDEITSVSAYIADYSVAGASMFAVLYEVDTIGGTTSYVFLEQSDDYTLQASDIDNWVTIGLINPYSAIAGQQYMVAIGGYANPVDTFGISTSGDSEISTSHIQDNGCSLGSQASGYWYYITSTPMIRMNFGNQTTSIVENSFEGVIALYPNPTYGNITLELNDVLIDKYSISVKNLLGQEIYSVEKIVNGFMKQNIDLSNYSRGSYLVTVKNSVTSISQKIIIE